MKTLRYAYSIVCFILFTLPNYSWAQNSEIPITTSSPKAMDYFLKGRDKFENFENSAAATLFEKAIQADPNFALAYLYSTFTGKGIPAIMASLEEATDRIDNVTEGEKYLILFIQASYNRNHYKQKEYLDLLLKDYPLDKRVHQSAGIFYYTTNDNQNALAHFTKAVEIDRKFAPAFNMVGYTQIKLKNYDQAEKAFQRYIQLTPDSPNGYDSYAELLLHKGEYDQSIVQYKKALEFDPHFSFSLVGLGHNYVFKGDYDTARKYYQDYYEHAPTPNDRYSALNWEAISYIYEGRCDNAIATYDRYRALAQKENNVEQNIWGLANQGHILIETGNPADGRKCYDQAAELIELSELDEATRNYLTTYSDLWHLYALSATGELEHAKEDEVWCTQNVEKRNNIKDEMFLNSVCGYQALKEGNYNHAIEHFSKADTEDPLKIYYHALALEKTGDTQNASMMMDKVAKCNDNSINLALVRNKTMKQTKKQIAYH